MRHLLTIFLLIFSLSLCSQDGRWLGVRASHGFLMPHRLVVDHLLQGPAQTLALEYSVGTDGSQDWHHHFARPQKGIGAYIKNTGAAQEIGAAYGVYPFLRLPLLGGSDHRLVYDIAIGLVYVSQTYDFDENPRTVVIGSHLNYGAIMGLKYQWVNGSWMLRTGPSISHASNAAFERPNLGINVVSWDVVLGIRLAAAESWQRKRDFEVSDDREINLSANIGVREGLDSEKRYAVQELRFGYQKRFSHKLSYALGPDLIHNRATYVDEQAMPMLLDALQLGLQAGLKVHFGDKELFFHQGVYLWEGIQDLGALYHRVGGRARFAQDYYVELGLKTHFAKADYLSLGIGKTLNRP